MTECRPDLEWIPVASCEADASYQRSIEGKASQRVIEAIAGAWSWAACGAILVMRAGAERFTVIDGQHRIEAAKRCGVDYLPGVVLAEMPVALQAQAFVSANRNRVQLTPHALHYARLAAEDIEALRVDAAVRRAEIVIARYPVPADKIKPNVTLAVGAVYRLVRRLDTDGAADVLAAVAEPFRAMRGMLRAPILCAAGQLYEATPTQAQRRDKLRRISSWLARHAEDYTVLHSPRNADVLDAMRRGTPANALDARRGISERTLAQMMAGR
jgi:ParB-like chromosome segregation protein Spo0J